MLYILTDKDGYVKSVATIQGEGYVAWNGTLPPRPIAEDDTQPRLILKDGQLVWQVGKTADEIAEERKKAYTEECDPYLVAYQGYLVEGDEVKAESARKAYLRAKAEVRARLPYNE